MIIPSRGSIPFPYMVYLQYLNLICRWTKQPLTFCFTMEEKWQAISYQYLGNSKVLLIKSWGELLNINLRSGLVWARESKRSGENYGIFTLTCIKFPQLLMVPIYIDKRLVLYPKTFKTSNVYFNKSVEALFSAVNYFSH